MGRRSLEVALIVCGCFWSAHGFAAAQERMAPQMPVKARLLLPSCEVGPFDKALFVDVLRLELAAHDVSLPANDEGTWTDEDARIAIEVKSCDPATDRVEIEIARIDTEQRVSRPVVFSVKERDRRARVLALGVSSFLTIKWPSLVSAKSERDEAIVALESKVATLQAQVKVLEERPLQSTGAATANAFMPRWLVGVGAKADYSFEFSTGTMGPTLWTSVKLHPHVQLQVAAAGGFGRQQALAGDVKVRSASGVVATFFGSGRGAWWVGVGPRLGVAWSRLKGEADGNSMAVIEEGTVSRVGVEVGAQMVARVALATRWVLSIDTHFSYGFRRVAGTTDEGIRGGVGGATLGLGLGIAYGFGN